MHEEILSEIGFSKSETAVYLALLKIGTSTTGPIIKESKIAAGKAYLILDKLTEKGLVTHSIQSGMKHFQAKDAEKLLDYMQEKENKLKQKTEQLKKIIPSLKAECQKNESSVAEVFEGINGFKTILDEELKQLKKGDCIDIMGVPKEANDRFQAYLLEWNKKRIAAGIKMRIIYNHNCRTVGLKREKMKLTEVKYMTQPFETPAWICVFKEYVTIKNVQGTPICFLFKNKETADSYKKYFQLIWEISEKG